MEEIKDANKLPSFLKNLLINFGISNSLIKPKPFIINSQRHGINPIITIRNAYTTIAYKIIKDMPNSLDFLKEDIIFCTS